MHEDCNNLHLNLVYKDTANNLWKKFPERCSLKFRESILGWRGTQLGFGPFNENRRRF